MEEKNLPAVAQNTSIEKASDLPIQVPDDWKDFTDEEAAGGMDGVFQGYVKKYKYFMYFNSPTSLIMNETENDKQVHEIKIGEVVKMIPIYAHHVKVFLRGHLERRTDTITKWPDEMKEVLAMSYDDSSRGNFDINGFGNFLAKPDRQFTTTKLYLIAVFPDLISGMNPVICSFGITSDSPKRPNTFATARLELDKFNLKHGTKLPIQYVYCGLTIVPDKNKDEESYFRPGITLAQKDGKPLPVFNNREHYKNSEIGEPLLRRAIKDHKEAVRAKELDKSSVPTKPAESQYNNNFSDLEEEIPFR